MKSGLIELENWNHHRSEFRFAAFRGDGRRVELQLAEAVADIGVVRIRLESVLVKFVRCNRISGFFGGLALFVERVGTRRRRLGEGG